MDGNTPSVATSLAKLRALAERMPRPGYDWEERPVFRAPADPEDLAELKRVAVVDVPLAFVEFLHFTDEVVASFVHNGYFLGGTNWIASSIKYEQPCTQHDRRRIVPIGSDGGGNKFILDHRGHVLRWNHENGATVHLADSFGGFLERVVADWEAYLADGRDWLFMV